MTDRIDTVVIGGSAGGFNALRDLLSLLPADMAAGTIVCLHTAEGELGARTADLLAVHTRLAVVTAADGAVPTPGVVQIAPPGSHTMLGKAHFHLRRGAHENNFRPAIDPLFRSAAVYRGPRTVAVVLSGLLDDGSAGARAVARMGGTVLVQDPDEAAYPDMPRAAIAAVSDVRPPDVLPLSGIAARLSDLCGTACAAPGPVPWQFGVELKIAALEGAGIAEEERMGELSPYNCPHCNGVLWEIEDGPLLRFRCHTGHAYSAEALAAAQEEALDRGLFDALRAHRGRVHLIRQMAQRTTGKTSRAMFHDRAERLEEDAERLEEIIKARKTA